MLQRLSDLPPAVADSIRAATVALTPDTITLPSWAVWGLAFWAFIGLAVCVLNVGDVIAARANRRRRERRILQQWARDFDQQVARDVVQRQTRLMDPRTWH